MQGPLWSTRFAVGAVFLVGAVAAGMAPARAQVRQTACGNWQVVNGANLGNQPSTLADVSTISPSDVWAAGGRGDLIGFPKFTVAEHWDGTSWTQTPTRNPHKFTTDANFFNSISAVSSTDVWAVGVHIENGGTAEHPLIEHWDGSRWTVSPVPPIAGDAFLDGVDGRAPDDAWAVGGSGNEAKTLILHWDGVSWSIIPSPNPTGNEDDVLFGMVAVASNDAWAVGSANENLAPLIEHWDGSRWSLVQTPTTPAFSYFRSVSAISSTEVWAVGTSVSDPLTEHWNGTAWSVVPSPGRSGSDTLSSVVALAPTNVEAVGLTFHAVGQSETLAENWNGGAWTLDSTPNPSSGINQLNGVSGFPNDLWAVGQMTQPSGVEGTLIEHCTA